MYNEVSKSWWIYILEGHGLEVNFILNLSQQWVFEWFSFYSRSCASFEFHKFSVSNFIVDVNLTWRMFLESNFLNFCKSRFVASKILISLKLRSREGFFSLSLAFELRRAFCFFLRSDAKNLSLEASFVRSDESCNYWHKIFGISELAM